MVVGELDDEFIPVGEAELDLPGGFVDGEQGSLEGFSGFEIPPVAEVEVVPVESREIASRDARASVAMPRCFRRIVLGDCIGGGFFE